ncbi:MAG TPA: hypothetical protein VGH28_12735 [Polyangiaceae bacterium]|jgi:hypothetical protein
MIERDLEALCRSCGLCCDGSLFGRVPLEPGEVDCAKKNRLRVIPSGASFEQPCRAFAGTCRVYDERPRACHAFECRLYDRHRREGGPLEARLASVRRARELLAAARPDEPQDELTALLERDFSRA